MEEVLQLIEGYGLPLVLLIGAVYALYRFFFFSVHEVKKKKRSGGRKQFVMNTKKAKVRG